MESEVELDIFVKFNCMSIFESDVWE